MLIIEANYSKKLGLPGYSSHQYSVTIRTELGDLKQALTEPANVVHTAAFLAQLRGTSVAHLAAATTANARRLFGLPAAM